MSNADRSIWQFPKNVANKVPGWRSDGKGLENKDWVSPADLAGKQDASPNLTTLSTSGVVDSLLPAFTTTSPSAAKIGFTNPLLARPAISLASLKGNERKIQFREIVGQSATPTAAQSRAAFQEANDALKTTGGVFEFGEVVTFDATPVLWDGLGSIRGVNRWFEHGFSNPENYGGSVIIGPAADLGNNAFGGAPASIYDQPNGLINIMLDTALISASRPRAHNIFENFAVYGSNMTGGCGLRVIGTMDVTIRDINAAWFPDWGIIAGPRFGGASANGFKAANWRVTSCGTAGVGGGVLLRTPDSYVENFQVGGNLGVGVHFWACSNFSAEQIQSWNNQEDNIRIEECQEADFHVISYDGNKSLIAIIDNSQNVGLSGRAWHANRLGGTAIRDTSSVYIEDDCGDITINDFKCKGDTYFARYSQYTAWAASTVVAASAHRVHDGRRYSTVAGGTTGVTPPTHTSGTVSDGGVLWTFESGYGLYGIYQEAASTGVLTVTSGVARDHRVRNQTITTPNVFGPLAERISGSVSNAAPLTIINAVTADRRWDIEATRDGAPTDAVTAKVVGGATPVIYAKSQAGTTLDFAVSGTSIRVTTSEVSAITVLVSWTRTDAG